MELSNRTILAQIRSSTVSLFLILWKSPSFASALIVNVFLFFEKLPDLFNREFITVIAMALLKIIDGKQ